MKRSRLIAVALLLPFAILTVVALRFADREKAEALRGLRLEREREAARLSVRLEVSLKEAFQKGKKILDMPESRLLSEGAPPVAVIAAGGDVVYGLIRGGRLGQAPSEKELHLAALSLRGGESFEFEYRDPEAALEAYCFYLPGIKNAELRNRLRFRAARAALKAGRTALGRAILVRLWRSERLDFTCDGLPIQFLAAEKLLRLDPKRSSALCSQAKARLLRFANALPTVCIKHFACVFAPGDPELRKLLALRERFEKGVRKCAEELVREGVAFGEELLFVSKRKEDGTCIGTAVAVPLPEFGLQGRFRARLLPGPAAAQEGRPDRSVLPILLSAAAPPLAFLEVTDLEYSNRAQRIERLWFFVTFLLLLTIGTMGAGGIVLVRLLEKEKKVSKLHSHLVANVSHELKSPVTSVRLLSELLSESDLASGHVKKFSGLLKAEALRLSQLVENLLDYSRLKRGEVVLEKEPVDLVRVLKPLAEAFALRAEREGVRFSFEVKEAGDFVIITNREAIERITLNLLDNALKYGRGEDPWIRLELEVDSGFARISVSDGGPGIPESELERIFQEFYRVNFEDYSVRGSGLGLALSQRLAEKLGGRIKAWSRPGEGSVFELRIPVAEGKGPVYGERADSDR